jgi:hypothetical protein
MDVYYVCPPWHLDSGIPCRNDAVFLKEALNKSNNLPLPLREDRGEGSKSMINPLIHTLILPRREMGLIQSFLN